MRECLRGDAGGWPIALAVALTALVGCGRLEQAPPAAASAPGAAPAAAVPAGAPMSPPSAQIRVGTVQAALLPADELIAPGRIIANPNRIARLLLPVQGRVIDVLAGLGSLVEQGQPVIRLDSPDADAAVAGYQQAEASLRQTQAALGKAEVDLARARDLYGIRAIAQKDLVGAENDVAQAQGGADAARAGRDQAMRRLELLGLKPTDGKQPVAVRAPIGGKVLEVNVAPGEYRTDTAAPLMTIADLTTVWMASDVPEPSVRVVHAGDPVSIALLAYPGESFAGRVARIADTLDPQTRTLKVYVELPNPGGRLRPEMFGSVRHASAPVRMPVLPPSAVVQEYGRSTVFVEEAPGQYRRRTVTVGAPAGDRLPVLAGIRAGDRVVVDGAILLKDR